MVNIIFLYFGKILQRLSGCMSLDFLITVPHGGVFFRCRVSVYQSITSYVRLLLFCFFSVLGCRYPGQSPGRLQLRWRFLIATMFVVKFNMEICPNLTKYMSINCSCPFSTLLINVRSCYCGESPHLQHHCHLGLFQRHPIDKNDRASTY
jgi:hypothetical protein